MGGDLRRAPDVGEIPYGSHYVRGPSRTQWEHSIPPLATLRYSVTFRTVAERAAAR